ncbi:MAG: oligosaccharide flippase family protein [Candidatus Hydrogenedentes bacterium]|nr:oligosaccharide flippase family protein [Candidatus Hydrogenedentota bacterium]
MSIRQTIARNTAYNAAGRLWDALSSLLLMRYVVDTVGLPAYGLWALLGSFNGYVSLLDLGIGSSFVKYIAEHAARAEDDEFSSVVSTGFFYYLVFGCALLGIGWPCVNGLVSVGEHFGLFSGTAPDDARFLLRWGLAIFAVSNCSAAFTSIQTGLQRMDVSNALSFVASLVKIGATVWFLHAGHGIRGLLWANAVSFAVFAIASVFVAFRLAPGLRLAPRYVRAQTFRKLFQFGWRAQVSKLSDLVMFRTDHVVAGVVFGTLGLVALYDLGTYLARMVRQVPQLLLTSLLPAASDLDAREEHERLRRLYLVSTKYVAFVTVPLLVFTVGCSGGLMRTWLGQGYETSAWVLRIIAFGYVANLVPGAGVSIALGKGRADVQMKAGLIATVSNIALTIALVNIPFIGFWGIPLGTMFSMYLSWAWFARAMGGIVGVGAADMFRAALFWPVLATLPGAAICGAADWLGRGLTGFAANATSVAICGVVFSVIYLSALWAAPFFDSFDIALMKSLGLKWLPGYQTARSTRRG